MNTLVNTLTGRFSGSLSSWTRDTRGSVSVEFVIGSVLIVTATVGGVDLYRMIGAQWLALHAATTMADYVSLEAAPNEAFIKDLAKFLYRNEIRPPSQAAFVVSAASRSVVTDEEPDPPIVVQWNRQIAVGEDPESPPAELGESCGRLGESGGSALQTLGMEPGEMVIVVEVCVALPPEAFVTGPLLAGNLFPTLFYRHQILPVRGDRIPEEPS